VSTAEPSAQPFAPEVPRSVLRGFQPPEVPGFDVPKRTQGFTTEALRCSQDNVHQTELFAISGSLGGTFDNDSGYGSMAPAPLTTITSPAAQRPSLPKSGGDGAKIDCDLIGLGADREANGPPLKDHFWSPLEISESSDNEDSP